MDRRKPSGNPGNLGGEKAAEPGRTAAARTRNQTRSGEAGPDGKGLWMPRLKKEGVMREYQQFIGGGLTASHSSDKIEVENPYTKKIVALAPQGDAVDAEAALAAAKAAQGPWAARTAADRASHLKKMAAVIREHRVFLAQTLAEEQAKVLPLAQVEIDFTADYFDLLRGLGPHLRGRDHQSDRPGRICSTASPSGWWWASAPGTSPSSSWPARWRRPF